MERALKTAIWHTAYGVAHYFVLRGFSSTRRLFFPFVPPENAEFFFLFPRRFARSFGILRIDRWVVRSLGGFTDQAEWSVNIAIIIKINLQVEQGKNGQRRRKGQSPPAVDPLANGSHLVRCKTRSALTTAH